MICITCNDEFIPAKNKPGKINECPACSEETVIKYTGNHKTCASIQINKDPNLTKYINNATKLQNKGSNLGNNLKVNSSMSRSSGACLYTAGSKINAKGKL